MMTMMMMMMATIIIIIIIAVKDLSGLLRTDGKRPDRVQLPWRTGKCVTWDVTVIDTLASSYVPATSQTPGAAA